jgi:hypothetical protein
LTVVVCVKLPDVPVIVTGTVPVVAVPPAASVNVLVAVAGLGLNDAVTPLGTPDADKLTLPLNPFCGVIVTVLVPLAPCMMLRLPGDAKRAKSGTGTVIDTLSKVAVTRAELLLALTARPMYTFCDMLMVRLDPTCTQFTPSDDAYPLNVLPLRTSLTQYGSPLTALLCDAVVPPVLARE